MRHSTEILTLEDLTVDQKISFAAKIKTDAVGTFNDIVSFDDNADITLEATLTDGDQAVIILLQDRVQIMTAKKFINLESLRNLALGFFSCLADGETRPVAPITPPVEIPVA